jgi:acyl dehydratase
MTISALKKISPEEWATRLETLPTPQRWAAARIVWWDYFADRPLARRWNHLDEMLASREEVSDRVLIDGLVAIGWTHAQAVSRVVTKEIIRDHKRINAQWRKGEIRKFGLHLKRG